MFALKMGIKLQLVSIVTVLCLMQSTMAKSLAFDSEGEVPTGYLQYHPERSGAIEDLIRRRTTSSGDRVKLIAGKFQTSSLSNDNNQEDLECGGPGCHNRNGDNLLIPDGVLTHGHGARRRRRVVAFAPPGPLYVFFNSDKYITRNGREIGFSM